MGEKTGENFGVFERIQLASLEQSVRRRMRTRIANYKWKGFQAPRSKEQRPSPQQALMIGQRISSRNSVAHSRNSGPKLESRVILLQM